MAHVAHQAPAVVHIRAAPTVHVLAAQVAVNPLHQIYLSAGTKLVVYNSRGQLTPIMLK
ncbi:hypothetical protein D3C80_2243690 [compost metagenome]